MYYLILTIVLLVPAFSVIMKKSTTGALGYSLLIGVPILTALMVWNESGVELSDFDFIFALNVVMWNVFLAIYYIFALLVLGFFKKIWDNLNKPKKADDLNE